MIATVLCSNKAYIWPMMEFRYLPPKFREEAAQIMARTRPGNQGSLLSTIPGSQLFRNTFPKLTGKLWPHELAIHKNLLVIA